MAQDRQSGPLQDRLDRLQFRAGQDRHIQRMVEHFSQEIPPSELAMFARIPGRTSTLPTPPSSVSLSKNRQVSQQTLPVAKSPPEGIIVRGYRYPDLPHSTQPHFREVDDAVPRLDPPRRPLSSAIPQLPNNAPAGAREPHGYSSPIAVAGSSSTASLDRSSPLMRSRTHQDPEVHRPEPIQGPRQSPFFSSSPRVNPEVGHRHQQLPATDLLDATPVAHGIRLVNPKQALSDKCRQLFPYPLLNAVQSKCFPSIYESNDNMVVSAPTGSGKTVILELAICRLVSSSDNHNYKIVYQAPTKALCSERAKDWEKKFNHMGLQVAELTGDTSQAEMRRVGSASIIITTPEKWDSITRKWQDYKKLLELVKLFLIDEVHILKDIRGSTLEAIVSRMKTIGTSVRFVALSATVPNLEDIARWLGRDHLHPEEPARHETFGEELRPVKLQKFVYAYNCPGNEHSFDKFLDAKLPSLLTQHSQGKPTLVFCYTRKSCEGTARMLGELWALAKPQDKAWPAPSKRIPVVSQALQEIVCHGVAFHHAGLDLQDRLSIEQNFIDGELTVVCCTSTLAVGVNLPCHTVVLKGTSTYQDNSLTELSDLEVMQMLGRAGRPQYDTSAIGVILTTTQNKTRYELMASGQQILESTLHLNLIEHLNSEIVLRTINDLESAKKWLAGTFLSVRLRKNPAHYRLTNPSTRSQPIEDTLSEICERDIDLLQDAELVTKGTHFRSTDYGRAMSTYMVKFETVKLLLDIPRGVQMEELLSNLCQLPELRDVRLRPTERAAFRELNRSPFILYPLRENVVQNWHKVSLLVQMNLGGVEMPNEKESGGLRRQLAMDKRMAFEALQRLVRCLVEFKAADLDAIGVNTGLKLARALAACAWDDRPTTLLQISGIGPVGMRKLVSHDVRTVQQLADLDYMEIERLFSRNPPFGKTMQEMLENFPRLTLDVAVEQSRPHRTKAKCTTVKVKAILGMANQKRVGDWQSRLQGLTFTAETGDGTLAYLWRGSLNRSFKDAGKKIQFGADLEGSNELICHFSCEEIVGTLVSKRLKIDGPAPRAIAGSPSEDLVDETIQFPDIDELLGKEPLERPPASKPVQESEDEFDDEPVKLPNGKWQCNHACSGSVTTRSGKPCSHKCCREGLDKPRKRKKTSGGSKSHEDIDAVARDVLRPSQLSHPAIQGSVHEQKRRRLYLSDDEISTSTTSSKVPKVRAKPRTNSNDRMVECIDLSNIDEDEGACFANAKGAPVVTTDEPLPPVGGQRLGKSSGTANLSSDLFVSDVFEEVEFDEFLNLPSQSSAGDEQQPTAAETDESVHCDTIADPIQDDTLEYTPAETLHDSGNPRLLNMEQSVMDEKGAHHIIPGGEQFPLQKSELSDRVEGEGGSCPTRGQVKEPAWVQKFDPELINFFRGHVNFI